LPLPELKLLLPPELDELRELLPVQLPLELRRLLELELRDEDDE
jgi:hypothetical protein